MFVFDDGMRTSHRPQIGFITELGSRFEDQSFEFLPSEFLQQMRLAAAGLAKEAVFTLLFISRHPSKSGCAMRVICFRDVANRQAAENRSYRTNANFVTGISLLVHREGLIYFFSFPVNADVGDVFR